MSLRPSIEVALDVRSFERIIVLGTTNVGVQYPERWERPEKLSDIHVDGESVVIIDCLELSPETIEAVLCNGPRIAGFVLPAMDREFEKRMRRTLKALYPFSEPWDALTDMGKCLMLQVSGPAYDRDRVIDQRKAGAA